MNENEEKCAENENKQIRKKEERELPQTKYNKKRRASQKRELDKEKQSPSLIYSWLAATERNETSEWNGNG